MSGNARYVVQGDLQAGWGFRIVDPEGNEYVIHNNPGAYPRNYSISYFHERADLKLKIVEIPKVAPRRLRTSS